MTTTREAVVAAALAGAASGCRTFTGLGALVAAAPADASRQPDRTLGTPAAKAGIALLGAGEYAADKLPKTPSRLAAPGLAGRLVAGALSGAIVARRERRVELAPQPGEPPLDRQDESDRVRVVACALAGTAAAVGAAVLGVRWRAWAGTRFGHDWPGAALEDALALGLAGVAVRLAE